MANKTIDGYNAAVSIDGAADQLLISQATVYNKINRNTLLNLTSGPVGLTDIQTLTNKTLTSPTINGGTLSGTLIGTYTLGGTPTFPASVITLTGTQVLTNKTLTSPTITSPTITNASISTDVLTGFTVATSGTVYGLAVTGGVISTNSVVPNNSLSNTGTFGVAWAYTTWSPAVVGFSSTTIAKYFYTQVGKTVFINVEVSGTSNSTSFTITLPVASSTHLGNIDFAIPVALDNSATLTGSPRAEIATATSTTILTLYINSAGGGWTASGTKLARFSGFYEAT